MLKSRFNLWSDVMRHRVTGALTILFLAVLAGPANSVEVPTLYTAEVVLDRDEDDPRAAAYRSALAEVLLRVSGSELSADRERVRLLFPNPASYVVQFRPGPDDTLIVSFDGEAVERVLRQAGQTVWGSDRPLTLIWLAVDWGQGRREIIGADDPDSVGDRSRSIDRNRRLRQRVLDVAQRRGLPVLFPLLDTDDLQNISFSDIWGGFDERLLEASKRYDAASVLVGRIRPTTSQRNRWSYYFAGEERTWSGEPELVVSLLADELAAEFAISGSAPLESLFVNVSGIDSVEAYGAVQQLLSGLTVIEDYSIAEVHGDRIRYRVVAHGGAERLRRALRFGGLIEQNGFDGDSDRFPVDSFPEDSFPNNSFPVDPAEYSLEFFYGPQ